MSLPAPKLFVPYCREYLLSIRGLGLKSVECVRLLTLHNLAFPVRSTCQFAMTYKLDLELKVEFVRLTQMLDELLCDQDGFLSNHFLSHCSCIFLNCKLLKQNLKTALYLLYGLSFMLPHRYPVLESIQKYLWPRLCKLDQRTLYFLKTSL